MNSVFGLTKKFNKNIIAKEAQIFIRLSVNNRNNISNNRDHNNYKYNKTIGIFSYYSKNPTKIIRNKLVNK